MKREKINKNSMQYEANPNGYPKYKEKTKKINKITISVFLIICLIIFLIA